MVEKTTARGAAPDLSSIEQEFMSEDAFKREPQQDYLEVVELETVYAEEEWMKARNIDFNDSYFREVFPDGYPVLKVGLRGVSVKYEFSPDLIRRVYIPLRNADGPNMGRNKGRRSHIHIFTTACQQVFGVVPFGTENQQAIIAAGPALWTQYLGEFTPQGQSQPTEWAWDIPYKKMPPGFKYDGEVRVIKAREGGESGTGGAAVGTTQLSEEESQALVVATLIGRPSDDIQGANDAVIGLAGLTQRWYDAAASGNVLAVAAKERLIHSDDGTIAKGSGD